MIPTIAHDKIRRKETIVPILDVAVTLLGLILGLWTWGWLGPVWVKAMRPDPGHIVDFYQDWGSSRNYWSGLPVYTPHSVSIPRYLGMSSNPMPSIEYNIHPPTAVLLALPLGELGYPDAVLVWNLISLAAFLGSFVIVAVVFAVPRPLIMASLALLPLCHPVYANVYQGQLNLVLVVLVTAMWVLERSGRPWLAGLMLGTAAAIKLFPIYLAIYYIVQGRARLLIATLISFLTLMLITALVLGPGTYNDYVRIVLPWNAEFRILGYNMSFAGFWHKLFHPVPGEGFIPVWSSLAVARWGTCLSNLIVTVMVAVLGYRAQTPAQRELAFSMTAIAMLLVSPVTWDVSLPLLLIPFVLIARSPLIAGSPCLSMALLAIIVVDCAPQPILTELMSGGHSVTSYSWAFTLRAMSLKFYMLLAAFLLALAAYGFEASGHQRQRVGSRACI